MDVSDEQFEPAEKFEIDDLEALGVITEETRIEILELLRHPLSVAQLAEKMGVPRTRLYHHIKQLEELGAVVVDDERRSGAMTEKIYRVAAKSFQPSQTFLETATPRDQGTAIIDSLFSITRTDFLRAVERGLVSLADADTEPQRMSASRRVFTLTPQRRDQLVERIESLLDEFNDEDTEGSEAFGVLVLAHPSSRSIT